MPFDIIFPLNLIAGLLTLPLKILGEVASVISLSFRLFGNIFGGSIIHGIFQQAVSGSLLFQSIALVSGLGLLLTCFFVIFEGFLQAFVFSILSLTTIAMATNREK
jgi:F-type H+-transporting ATPase subunit a